MIHQIIQKKRSVDAEIPQTQNNSLDWIPQELRNLPNWIEWRLDDEDGKVPFIPKTNRWASVNDPATWRRFEDIKNIPVTNRGGIGFVLGGESKTRKLIGVDLDGCLHPDGTITSWARKIIRMLPSYCEITPSGTGLRIWTCGNLPAGDRMFKFNPEIGVGPKVQVEVFDEGKYFTVTGSAFEPDESGLSCSYVENIPNKLMMEFYQFLYDLRAENPAPRKLVSRNQTSGDSVQLKCTTGLVTTKMAVMMTGKIVSKSPVVVEDSQGNQVIAGSQSECDLSLCTALALNYGDNPDAIDTEFRKSALYREKWERGDYRDNTIDKAIKTALRIKKEDAERQAAASPNVPMEATVSTEPITQSGPLAEDEVIIPTFDRSIMTGVCKEMVELITADTTLDPQFTYGIARTYLGLRMAASGVVFPDLDMEPRNFFAMIGQTGSGKGEAWRRVQKILSPQGSIANMSKVKVIEGLDSGAGLKDSFFDDDLPILVYIDEIGDLGHKSEDSRNPSILDTLLTLADSTTVSRTLAKSRRDVGVTSKTKNNARVAVVMGGVSGDRYMAAFPQRSKEGWFDRLYPEFGVAVEGKKLPPINPVSAIKLLNKMDGLPWGIRMEPPAAELDKRFDDFWATLPAEVRKKNRWAKQLRMDAYISAFSRGETKVTGADVEGAIRMFQRTLFIRRESFTEEVPDKTGSYLGLLKKIHQKMVERLRKGAKPQDVAITKRDFQKLTHATRANEEHLLERAWQIFSKDWLTPITVNRSNGHTYIKFVPADEDPGS